MARLSSQKHESFCLSYLELGRPGAAYRAATGSVASDRSCRASGAKWYARADIRGRIDELRQLEPPPAGKVTEAAGADADWVLREARVLYARAMDDGSLSVALKALEIIGKHAEVQAFRDQVDHRHFISPDEARAVIAALLPKYAGTLERLQ